MPAIIGIDPGVSPTVCVLYDDRGKPPAVEFYDGDETSFLTSVGGKRRHRPSAPLLANILRNSLAELVIIEDVHAMPKEGPAGAFSFGRSVGIVEGVAHALGKRVVLVTPAVWKKAVGIPAGANKAMSRHAMATLVPHLADLVPRVMHHNRADAFLLAWWGRGKL